MAKTKTVKAWGVFKTKRTLAVDDSTWGVPAYVIGTTKAAAKKLVADDEHGIGPVTISWEVDE